ncbi:MAG TPA: hypothetical protein VN764_17310 [Polyangiaceae bacterium]|nr:hypothetical protein [Polyangiaceae bacterium]
MFNATSTPRGVPATSSARRAVVRACLLLVTVVSGGCSKSHPEHQPEATKASPRTAPRALSPDRLPPDALLEGEQEAFGFRFPQGMTVSKLRKQARAEGEVNFDQLVDYVKARISARHAEMFGPRLVFPRAAILGHSGDFTLTLIEGKREQVLLIEDESRSPATVGLSEAERWKRVGLKPNGELIDPKGME